MGQEAMRDGARGHEVTPRRGLEAGCAWHPPGSPRAPPGLSFGQYLRSGKKINLHKLWALSESIYLRTFLKYKNSRK